MLVPNIKVNQLFPAWSSDGRHLASGKEKLLFHRKIEAREASFTLSRHLVAFSGLDPNTNRWQIFTYDFVYGNLNLLTEAQGNAYFPVFTPDGKKLAYAKEIKNGWKIVIIKLP